MSNVKPITVSSFLNSLGVNTHVPYTDGGYANISNVAADLAYLGITHVRDGISDGVNGSAPLSSFIALARQGITFTIGVVDASVTDTASLNARLLLVQQLVEAVPGSVTAIEGANEVNNWPVTFNGVGGLQGAVDLQKAIYSAVQSNPAFAGIAVDYFTGYAAGSIGVGPNPSTTAGLADYDNQHPYPLNGAAPAHAINPLTALGNESGASGPFVYTETGYSTYGPGSVNQDVQAKYTLDLLFDAVKDGAAQVDLYQLLDAYAPGSRQGDDGYGLFDPSNAPKEAATAIHNLTTILADPGPNAASFFPTSLNVSFAGLPATGNEMVLQKSSGAYDIVVWAEPQIWNAATGSEMVAPSENVTVNFGSAFQSVSIYDPLAGSSATRTLSNTDSVEIAVTDHPIIIEVAGSAASVAEAIAFESEDLAVSDPTLSDTAANIESLTVAQISALDSIGVTEIAAVDASVSLSVAQATAMVGAGLQVSAPEGKFVAISDTAANIGALTAAEISGFCAIGVTEISASNSPSDAAQSGWTSYTVNYANGLATTKTVTGASGSLYSSYVNDYDPSGTQVVDQTGTYTSGATWENLYSGGVITSHTVEANGNAATYGWTSYTVNYVNGLTTTQTVTGASGSSYISYVNDYDSSGTQIVEQTGTSADGETWKSLYLGGVIKTRTVEANGNAATYGWTSYTVNYVNGLATTKTVTGASGSSYSSYVNDYDPSGTQVVDQTGTYTSGATWENLYSGGVITSHTVDANGNAAAYGWTSYTVNYANGLAVAQTVTGASGSSYSSYVNDYDSSGAQVVEQTGTSANGATWENLYSGGAITSQIMEANGNAAAYGWTEQIKHFDTLGKTSDTTDFTAAGNSTTTVYGSNTVLDSQTLGGVKGQGIASIVDLGQGFHFNIDAVAQVDNIAHFGSDANGVVELLNGVGGYGSVASLLHALQSDGHGGALLSLGSAGSLDFVGVAVGQLSAANFKIG